MEYRKLPHGTEQERFSVLGIGMGGIHQNTEKELEALFSKALEYGINYFDMCAGGQNVFRPFGKAIAGSRKEVFFPMHFGAVFNEAGEYGWTRDVEHIKRMIDMEFSELGTDYADFGFLHCVDTDEDYDQLVESGVLDYIQTLKKQGAIHHIGFSSHTPSVANRILNEGYTDMMLFSINPAYDYEAGDEYGIGTVSERAQLFCRCQAEGVGISVMKPFFGGNLLTAETSPFGHPLTKYQCLQYAIDRPGVLTAVPGVRNMEDLDALLGFANAGQEEKDYSVIASWTAKKIEGTCVYCSHCHPCPAGIDIGLVNKYYDLAKAGDKLAVGHYEKLAVHADACLECGHCTSRCPFGVDQQSRMQEIGEYFRGKR